EVVRLQDGRPTLPGGQCLAARRNRPERPHVTIRWVDDALRDPAGDAVVELGLDGVEPGKVSGVVAQELRSSCGVGFRRLELVGHSSEGRGSFAEALADVSVFGSL